MPIIFCEKISSLCCYDFSWCGLDGSTMELDATITTEPSNCFGAPIGAVAFVTGKNRYDKEL